MKQCDDQTIRQIENAITHSGPISAGKVREWMACDSLQAQGALKSLILSHSRRIEPPLSIPEICEILELYYRRCLIENTEGGYVSNRQVSGYELVNWFNSLWMDHNVPREQLHRLKSMLRELCLARLVPEDEIVTAVLEHLFERIDIQEFFEDWRTDPRLANAYALAKMWGDDHLIDSRP